MRALLLGAIGALSLLTTTNAQAGTWEQWFRWAGASLRQSGVTVRVSESCDPRFAALYTPKYRTITLCQAAVARGYAYSAEALAHEAIHAAQHCLGLRQGIDAPVSISQFLAQRGKYGFSRLTQRTLYTKRSAIYGSTSIADGSALLEAEAYTGEDTPTQAIQLAEAACQ